MVVSDITTEYEKCENEHCRSTEVVAAYDPNTFQSLEHLERSIRRKCSHCGMPLGIVSIKVKVLRKE